ncbi:NUDIX hydrolase [Rhodobacteraceae bacterium NNCM2]|nr:NUDIX hydrolase [Coraliihabitans acroporae]
MTAPKRPKDAIRDASTVILLRKDTEMPRILMGQRGKAAAFMPSKYVFPGGAVDAEDASVPLAADLPERLTRLLSNRADAALVKPLVLAAIRELWEETGLALSLPGEGADVEVPRDWQSFFAAGHRPAPDKLELVFRAITPPGRPRRFDARFFLIDASEIAGDLDDFSLASDELSHLHWLTLAEARRLDLPFITEVVLAEVEARIAPGADPRPVPFFHHTEGKSFLVPL